MFPIDRSLIPSLTTRRALLVIDLQNDFVLPDGKLPVTEPSGYVERTVELANTLRSLGNVDIIWIRSEFGSDQRIENEQVITSDTMRSQRAPPRGRGRVSAPHVEQALEQDEEAFLSTGPPGTIKPACVRHGDRGSALVAQVEEIARRDYMLTKTHYSAFQTGQLLQRLRGRFVTELYVCGALTNVSIYATALDAGMHGYSVTLIEDCCGYRNDLRHTMAVSRLIDLTGCEISTAEDVLESLQPSSVAEKRSSNRGSREQSKRRSGGAIMANASGGANGSKSPQSKTVRDPAPAPASASAPMLESEDKEAKTASALAARLVKLQLSSESPSADARPTKPDAQPHKVAAPSQPLQPVVKSRSEKYDGSEILQRARDSLVDSGDSSGRHRKSVGMSSKTLDNKTTTPPRPSSYPGGGSKSASKSSRRTSGSSRPAGDKSGTAVFEQGAPTKRDSVNGSGGADSGQRTKDRVLAAKPQKERLPASRSELDLSDSSSSSDVLPIMANAEGPITSAPICEGDTAIIRHVLPLDLASTAFGLLKEEVSWQRMSHQGGEVPRLVAVQGAVEEDGTMPVYRHPSDESPPLLPFTATVLAIKSEVERHLGHSLNHVLIQLYRDGNDYISEHSDKTLDIFTGSYIANVSLGAERTMVFRTKRADKDPSRKTKPVVSGDENASSATKAIVGASLKGRGNATADGDVDGVKRQVERANLPHNSLCRMGLKTNMRWLHSIRQDKRLPREKTPAELGEPYGGARISLTFRRIGTFLSPASPGSAGAAADLPLLIWGQGATSKTKAGARSVLNGQTPEAVRMLQAFGTENHSSEFDWKVSYGAGFDVLHMNAAPRFFAGPDAVANGRVGIMLAECGVLAAKGSLGAQSGVSSLKGNGRAKTEGGKGIKLTEPGSGEYDPAHIPIKFVDNDATRSTVDGELAILLYLDAAYGIARTSRVAAKPDLARIFSRFQLAMALGDKWRSAIREQRAAVAEAEIDKEVLLKNISPSLLVWEGYAAAEAEAGETLPAAAPSESRVDAEGDAKGWASGLDKSSHEKPVGDGQEEAITKHPESSTSGSAIFITGGAAASIVDAALWPVLRDVHSVCGLDSLKDLTHLVRYFHEFGKRASAQKAYPDVAR